MAAATQYCDFATPISDFFSKGYEVDTTVSVKTVANGVTLESGGKVSNKNVDGFVKGEYRDADFGKVSGQVWTTGKATATVTADKLVQDTKFVGKVNSSVANAKSTQEPSAELCVEYAKPSFAVSSTVDFGSNYANVNVCGAFKQDNLSLGADAQIAAHGPEGHKVALRDFGVGLRYSNPTYTILLQCLNNGKQAPKPQTMRFAYLFTTKQNHSVAAQFEHQGPGKCSLTVGTQYEDTSKNKYRVKANNQGQVAFSVNTKLTNPQVESSFTLGFDVNTLSYQTAGFKFQF